LGLRRIGTGVVGWSSTFPFGQPASLSAAPVRRDAPEGGHQAQRPFRDRLGLITNWCANPGEDVTALLAPPVVEIIGQRGVTHRRVEDFGLKWPLRVADGL